MTISARLIPMLLNIIGVGVDPTLADDMETMRSIQAACRQACGVTNAALGNAGGVTLQLNRGDIIIRIRRGILRVR